MPTLAIPVEYSMGQTHSTSFRKWILNEYVWTGQTYGMEYESTSQILSLGPSLANFHPGMVNMGVQMPKFAPLLDLCHDVGAGASSDYVGCAFATPLSSSQPQPRNDDDDTTPALQAGEELFVSYGDNW